MGEPKATGSAQPLSETWEKDLYEALGGFCRWTPKTRKTTGYKASALIETHRRYRTLLRSFINSQNGNWFVIAYMGTLTQVEQYRYQQQNIIIK